MAASLVLIHAETSLIEDGFLTESLLEVCNLATTSRLNTMFIGPFDLTQSILASLRLETPVQRVTPEDVLVRPFSPPPAHIRTVIIDDIASFGPRNQRRLYEWLEERPGRARIVSIAPRALVQAVADKTFLESLYYRLNTVYIDLTGAHTSA
jgi:hypothetical protein